VRAAPVVVELPLLNSPVNLVLGRSMVEPELVEVRKLRTLDLAIEVWGAWRNRPEFDALVHQTPLHRFGEELATPVGLDTLDWKWHLFDDTIKKKQRISGVSARVDSQRKREQSSMAVY
jgi:hypothetical protein